MPLLSNHDLSEREQRYREIDRILGDLEHRHGRRGSCRVLAMCLGVQAERTGMCLRRLYTTTRAASGLYASDEYAVDGEPQGERSEYNEDDRMQG